MRGARPEYALRAAFHRAEPFQRGGTILLAVSGGSDSVALAGLAAAAACETAISLHIVHVNHQVRASAAQDEAVVAALGARLHIPVHSISLTPSGDDEAHLRNLRYAAMAAVAEDLSAQTLLTGHSAQDQTETVLLALFRGTGRDGLCGMPQRRTLSAHVDLVRPLLALDRVSLQRYCEREHLPYAVDPSNTDERYARNAIRRHLSELRPLFPGLDRAVARCAKLLAEERLGGEHATNRHVIREVLRAAGFAENLTYERLDAAARLLQLSDGRTVRIGRKGRK